MLLHSWILTALNMGLLPGFEWLCMTGLLKWTNIHWLLQSWILASGSEAKFTWCQEDRDLLCEMAVNTDLWGETRKQPNLGGPDLGRHWVKQSWLSLGCLTLNSKETLSVKHTHWLPAFSLSTRTWLHVAGAKSWWDLELRVPANFYAALQVFLQISWCWGNNLAIWPKFFTYKKR